MTESVKKEGYIKEYGRENIILTGENKIKKFFTHISDKDTGLLGDYTSNTVLEAVCNSEFIRNQSPERYNAPLVWRTSHMQSGYYNKAGLNLNVCFFVKISDNSVKTIWIFRIVKDFYEKNIYYIFGSNRLYHLRALKFLHSSFSHE